MKKISLKNVKETLSRKEMRSIAGGYNWNPNCNMPCYMDLQCQMCWGVYNNGVACIYGHCSVH